MAKSKKLPLLLSVPILIAVLLAVAILPQGQRSAQAAPPGTSTWSLAFEDNFDGTSLDTNKWVTCWFWAGPDGGCINEANPQVSYVLPRNVSVSNGALHLRTVKENYTPPGGTKTYNWTSGMVTTGRIGDRTSSNPTKFSFTYGYMEMRGRLATGNGVYSAFWTGSEDHGWPPEIDVFEMAGDKPKNDHMTHHWNDGTGNKYYSQDYYSATSNLVGEWHTYGVDWQPGLLIWYIDGREITRSTVPAGVSSEAMHLLISTEIWKASSWTSGPDATTPTTSTFDVDYVRIWQRQGSQTNVPPSLEVLPVANFGTAGNGTSTYEKATDNNFDTAFDAADSTNCYTGVDLGSSVVIDKLRYSPRKWQINRFAGGQFQASNSQSGPWTTLFTLPTAGYWYDVYGTTIINNTTAYRYYRYVGPAGGHCNIAEMEFHRPPSSGGGTLTKIAPTASFGTAGNGTSTYEKVSDGNFNTAFDAVSSSSCHTGIDAGSGRVVKQIKYSPRKYENDRMAGGQFQASNSQSGPWSTIYTIPSGLPPYDTFTTASTSGNTTSYRYYRYVGPSGGHCNIAEMEFYY